MIVIAHRGASWDEPENTLPAFERAIAVGADYVEFDVQAASDGGLVVFHDLHLDRLTPATGPLRARPLAELRELGIPTLEEVLELTAGRIGVMAELKSPRLYRRHDIVARTLALLGRDAVVVSFSRAAPSSRRAGCAPRCGRCSTSASVSRSAPPPASPGGWGSTIAGSLPVASPVPVRSVSGASSTRSTSRSACAVSHGSAPTGSSAIVRIWRYETLARRPG